MADDRRRETEPTKFAASADLVRVAAVIPESHPGDGAILVMRDGTFRAILKCSPINSEMKSQEEREGITLAFGEMLNSLKPESPISIIVHARQIDPDAYTRQFEARLHNSRTPPQVRQMLKAHLDHYETQVKSQRLLQRERFVIVPFKGRKVSQSPTQQITGQLPFSQLIEKIGRATEQRFVSTTPDDAQVSRAKRELELRCSEIQGRMSAMGIKAKRLNEDEAKHLLYECFHPGLSQVQRNPDLDVEGRMISGFSADQPMRRARPGIPALNDSVGELPAPPRFSK